MSSANCKYLLKVHDMCWILLLTELAALNGSGVRISLHLLVKFCMIRRLWCTLRQRTYNQHRVVSGVRAGRATRP